MLTRFFDEEAECGSLVSFSVSEVLSTETLSRVRLIVNEEIQNFSIAIRSPVGMKFMRIVHRW